MVIAESARNDEFLPRVKLLLIGNSTVGKTSLLTRYLRNRWDLDSQSTVGVEFGHCHAQVGSQTISVLIWDAGGQERFRSLVRSFYRGTNGLIYVYSLTDRTSFLQLEKWIADISQHCAAPALLLANKSDLEAQRAVTWEEGYRLAQRYSMQFIEVSAKTGNEVNRAFTEIATIAHSQQPRIAASVVTLHPHTNTPDPACCTCW